MDNDGVVQYYITDSGAFKANKFVSHINEMHQTLRLCGTNAHHQNGFSGPSIQTISNIAQAMIFNASIHWKDGCESSPWPLAVTYATNIHSSIPRNGIFPEDLFTVSTIPCHHLMDFHVLGCTIHIIDPKSREESSMMGTPITTWHVHGTEKTTHQKIASGSQYDCS
jgi:hypothetical protein